MEFTADYTTIHTDAWLRHCGPICGRAGAAVLELGTYEGRTALWWCDTVLSGAGAKIVCVDDFPDPPREARFDRNTAAHRAAGRIEKVGSTTGSALHRMLQMPAPRRPVFDVAYVDASHRAADVALDGLAAWALLAPGGLLILDDYDWGRGALPATERPQMAIDLLVAGLRGVVVDFGKQVLLKKEGPSCQ